MLNLDFNSFGNYVVPDQLASEKPANQDLISQGLFQQFWEKAPGQNWEKMIDFKSKLGEINYKEKKGSKIYPQSQVILDCIMPSIQLKHKCLSIFLIWVIVSHK